MHDSGEPSCSSYDLAERGYGTCFNGTSFFVGRPQACVNGSRAPICGSLSQEEAVLICINIQDYYGECSVNIELVKKLVHVNYIPSSFQVH